MYRFKSAMCCVVPLDGMKSVYILKSLSMGIRGSALRRMGRSCTYMRFNAEKMNNGDRSS